MTGLLYKECKQNRLFIVLTACVPILVFTFPMLILSDGFDISKAAVGAAGNNGGRALLVFVICGFAAVGEFQTLIFNGDDTKKWGYFIASNPEGIKGFLYTKYMLVLGMSALYFTALWFWEGIFGVFLYVSAKCEYMPMTDFYITIVYLQILLRAIDIPFIVRFGVKQGSIIKMIALVSIVLLFVAFVVANPEMMAALAENISKLSTDKPGDAFMFIMGSIPIAAAGAFVLSYKISCRLYMRGVEHYDK